jgi:hypothetical protein
MDIKHLLNKEFLSLENKEYLRGIEKKFVKKGGIL